jgi:hypothetical protein
MLEEVSARVAADPELIIEIEFAESSPKGLGKCIRVRIGGLPPPFGRLPPAPALTVGTFLSWQLSN